MRYAGFGLVSVVFLGSCQVLLGIDDVAPADRAPEDAAVDPGSDATLPNPECQAWTPRYFDPCNVVQPSGELVLENGKFVYDTTSMTLTREGDAAPIAHMSQVVSGDGGDAALIMATRFVLAGDAELRARGSRPLIIASWTEIVMDGLLDAGSRQGEPGAGARTSCTSPAQAGGGGIDYQDDECGGGGGGGGYGAAGGSGGGGGFDGTIAPGGPAGGAEPLPPFILGGCPGASGADGAQPSPGAGGPGGGAVALAARQQLFVRGRVQAGGAGGGGGTDGSRAGGGGGGSGGMIALDAPSVTVTLTAILAANGGGGGEGGDLDDPGTPGQDGMLNTDPAPGGSGGADAGGNGGAGGSIETPDNGTGLPAQALDYRGGGGGGGGVGHIVVFATENYLEEGDAIVSPAVQRP